VGGYPTVLTFTLETLRLGREGAIALTRTNVAASVVAGNIALWLGALLARTL
jgi:fluoride ion exporter CrcB/FEX